MKKRPLFDSDYIHLGAALRQPGASMADRIAMGFALGNVCEDHGRCDEAFRAWSRANAELRTLNPWQPSAFHTHANALFAASLQLARPVDPTLGHEVIFTVGLPRSGSTLFGQIRAAHPEVEGASELNELEQVLGEESTRREQPLLQWMGAAHAADWQRLGCRYLALTARWRRQKRRHSDKLPSNWLLAGVLGAMLPGARIVDARRDGLQAGWFCYKQQFYRLPHFACMLTDSAAYTRDYERIMDLWQTADPQRTRLQRYEALRGAPEEEIRALRVFCALAFVPACLDYHRASRSVRTASAAQVRQPLRRDTARANHYGTVLDPLRFGPGLPTIGRKPAARDQCGHLIPPTPRLKSSRRQNVAVGGHRPPPLRTCLAWPPTAAVGAGRDGARSVVSGALRQRRLAGVRWSQPVFRGQHRQAMRQPGLVALRADRPEFPRGRHLPAHRRPLQVDAAVRGLSHGALQRRATRVFGVRTAHRQSMRVELFGQLRRHGTAKKGRRFRPMEGHAKVRATGTAT